MRRRRARTERLAGPARRKARHSDDAANGTRFTLRFRHIGGGNLELDGLFTKRVEKFASNAKLDGHYSWSGGASGGVSGGVSGAGTAVSASRGYQFNPDGTFSTSSLAGVSAGKFGESSAGAGSGTY